MDSNKDESEKEFRNVSNINEIIEFESLSK